MITIQPELLEAITSDAYPELHTVGIKIGKLYTDQGLPLDMAMAQLERKYPLTKTQKITVLSGAQSWLIEHRRNSAATDKALDRQRAVNKEVMERFIKTGETGVY